MHANPNPEGEGPAPGVDSIVQAFSPALGPLSARVMSSSLTMASVVLFDIRLPDPSIDGRIDLTFSIEQTFVLASPGRPGERQSPLPMRHRLRATSLQLARGHPARLRDMARLPSGDWAQRPPTSGMGAAVRASTHDCTKTPIRVSHRVRAHSFDGTDAAAHHRHRLQGRRGRSQAAHDRQAAAHRSCLPHAHRNADRAVHLLGRGHSASGVRCFDRQARNPRRSRPRGCRLRVFAQRRGLFRRVRQRLLPG